MFLKRKIQELGVEFLSRFFAYSIPPPNELGEHF